MPGLAFDSLCWAVLRSLLCCAPAQGEPSTHAPRKHDVKETAKQARKAVSETTKAAAKAGEAVAAGEPHLAWCGMVWRQCCQRPVFVSW